MASSRFTGRTRVDQRGQALFEPGERIVGAFDAVTAHPYFLSLRYSGLVDLLYGGGWGVWFLVIFGLRRVPYVVLIPVVYCVTGLACCVLSWLVCHRVKARYLMFALTTFGLVVCEVDWLRRPRAIVERMPPIQPEIVKRGRFCWQVRFGNREVSAKERLRPVLGWMDWTATQG
ncbi:MAG: hypothetical protein ACRDZ8_09930 [Acidimicrobiales bacterium]